MNVVTETWTSVIETGIVVCVVIATGIAVLSCKLKQLLLLYKLEQRFVLS